MRHFIDMLDWNADDIRKLLKEAARLKKEQEKGRNKPSLQGRVLGLIFEKPSLRTRVSFEAAIAHLGGTSLFLGGDSGLGTRESLPDFARTVSRYVDVVVLRTFRHRTIEEFAQWSSCPVINGLSDYYHPCQALGDVLTMIEIFGTKLQGKTVAFIGDGNNVARSLALACGKLGVRFVLSAPRGYGFDKPFLDYHHLHASHGTLTEEPDPQRAVVDADVIYSDVWASMGQEEEAAERRKKFAPFQVNGELMRLAPQHCRFMHCLPAHRGEEVTDEVLESDRSVVFPQAENRMHAQKALLEWILGS